jgi:hypothetical protein
MIVDNIQIFKDMIKQQTSGINDQIGALQNALDDFRVIVNKQLKTIFSPVVEEKGYTYDQKAMIGRLALGNDLKIYLKNGMTHPVILGGYNNDICTVIDSETAITYVYSWEYIEKRLNTNDHLMVEDQLPHK